MKKVLALVLAVIMVCTMAMAVKVEGTTNSGATGGDYAVVHPGTTLKVTFTPYDGDNTTPDDGIHYYLKGNKFVPANNEVKITFAKGADLVESKGWVKISDDEGVAGYEYQIKLKSNLNKIVDKSVADIQISKITFKSTGYDLVEVFAETKASNYISYAYGYEQNNVILQEDNAASFTFAENSINVITSLHDKAGKEVSSLKVVNNGMTYTFNKGAKVYAMKDPVAFNVKDDAGYHDNNVAMTYANRLNSAAKVIYEKGTNVDTTYRVYAKGVDGKVKSVVATTTDGVMTFTVPALSTVIVTTDVLTTTGTVGTATTETPGTTTNPGTGANDVVGVAAALAVVALVSGAAISLKK